MLLPSLVKRDFPQRVAGLTSAYVLTMSVIAGVASAVAIPLAMLSDATWRFSALCLLAVPALGALLWLPQLSRRTRPASVTAHARTASGCGAARWPGRSRCSWASIPSCSMQW